MCDVWASCLHRGAETSDSVSQRIWAKTLSWRFPFLASSTFLRKYSVMVWGHPAVLLFWWQLWGSCAGRWSFTATGIDIYLNLIHWSWVENMLGHLKSHAWVFWIFRDTEQWATPLGLGDIHLQVFFSISLYLSFLIIQARSEKQHLPASHNIHIYCCWGGFTAAAAKIPNQSCTLKCQSSA